MFPTISKSIMILALLLASTGFANAEQLTIKGSDTVLPLSQKLAEVYLKKHPNKVVSVVGGGSGVGISSLIDGLTDIAQSSRDIKKKEIKDAKKKGITPVETVIARDALAVITNPKNPVSQLTLKQIEGIFTGKITNWKEVGGKDLQIVAYSRESSSGTYVFFRETAMSDIEYSNKVLLMPATGAIVQSISQTEGAIGYVGHAYLTNGVKALKIGDDKGNFIEPTTENALKGIYPITRGLFYYTNGNPKGLIKDFVDFALSAEGQKIVDEVGYIKIK